MIHSQMLKGILEGCIMAIISKKASYGYEISLKLEGYGFGKITEGTIYPLLLRLEKNGFVSTEYVASELGPRRKYYSLTESGMNELNSFMESYYELGNAVDKLLEEVNADED